VLKPRLGVIVACALLLAAPGTGCAQKKQPLRLVPSVDLARYAGQWYEIARLPNRFQTKCAGEVIANYSLRSDGQVTVLNRCNLANGENTQVEGRARLAGKEMPNSALKVRFAPAWLSFLPQVWGNYQVISLAPDYSHAIVGDPSRTYLWFLSRTPALDEITYAQLVSEAKAQGFNVDLLQRTRQDVR
jgi:apolipoprotein D and lipocalin family protein